MLNAVRRAVGLPVYSSGGPVAAPAAAAAHAHAHALRADNGHGAAGVAVPRAGHVVAAPERDLVFAAKVGDAALARRLLDEADAGGVADAAGAAEADGTTPLHWAALHRHVDVVRLLLERGAAPGAANASGHTPMHWAAIGGDARCAMALLLGGGDPQRVDKLGHNGLLHAAQYGHPLAVYFFLHTDRFAEGVAALPAPLAARASLATPVTYADPEGHTALHWAAYQGHLPVVRFLLQEGARLDEADNNGCTAVTWAAIRAHPAVIEFLVAEGAAYAHADGDGLTPAAWAAKKQHGGTLRLLQAIAAHPAQFTRAARRATASPLWLAIGAVGAMLVSLLFLTQPFYVSWPVVLGTRHVAWPRVRHALPGATTHKSPLWVGIFTGLFVLSAFVYFTRIVDDYAEPGHPIPGAFHALFIAANLVTLPVYYSMPFRDPGVVRKTELNDIRAFVAEVRALAPGIAAPSPPTAFAAGRGADVAAVAAATEAQFCVTCGLLRPLRAKHCRACDTCYAKHDHHCGWLNVCVAANNLRAFVLLLFAMWSMHLMFVGLCYLSLTDAGAVSLWRELPALWAARPFIVWMLFVHCIFLVWMSALALTHIWQVSVAMTTNEAVNRHRYAYLHPTNPFDQGRVRNCVTFFSQTEPWNYMTTYEVKKKACCA